MFNQNNDFGYANMFGNNTFSNNQNQNFGGQSYAGNFVQMSQLNTIDDLVKLFTDNTPNFIQAIMAEAQRIQSNTTQGIYNQLGNALGQNNVGQYRALLSAGIWYVNHESCRGKNINEILPSVARFLMMYLGAQYGGNNDLQFKQQLNATEASAMPKFIQTAQDMVNVAQTLLKRNMQITQQMDLNPSRNQQGIQGFLNQSAGMTNQNTGWGVNGGEETNPLLQALSEQGGSTTVVNNQGNGNNNFGYDQQFQSNQQPQTNNNDVANFYLKDSASGENYQHTQTYNDVEDDYVIPGETFIGDSLDGYEDDGLIIPGQMKQRSRMEQQREQQARQQAQAQIPPHYDTAKAGQAIKKPTEVVHGQTMSQNGQYVPSREIQNPDLKRKILEREMGYHTSGPGAPIDENLHLDNYDDYELDALTQLNQRFQKEDEKKFAGDKWDTFAKFNSDPNIDRMNGAIESGVTWGDDGMTAILEAESIVSPAGEAFVEAKPKVDAPLYQHAPETKDKRVWFDKLPKKDQTKTLLGLKTRLKMSPAFNLTNQRLEVVCYGSFKIIRVVEDEDMKYENHVLEDKINPLTGQAGAFEVAEMALDIANQPYGVKDYKEEIKDLEGEELAKHKLFNDIVNIDIEDTVLVSNSQTDYNTLPIQYIAGELGDDVVANLDNCVIKYTQVSHVDFVTGGEDLEKLERLLTLEDSAEIAEVIQDFVTNNKIFPARTLAAMVQKFTAQVNNLLKIEIHPEYEVTNAVTDAIDLGAAVLEDGYDDETVNDIYRYAVRVAFIPFTQKRLEGLNATIDGQSVAGLLPEDHAWVGGLERILLLPYSFADLPIGVKGEFAVVTNDISKSLYSLLTSEFDNNEDVQTFKLITMDNVIYEFIRPVGGNEIVLKANQYTSD